MHTQELCTRNRDQEARRFPLQTFTGKNFTQKPVKLAMASKTPCLQKYTGVDFMEKTAYKEIEKIMRSYLRGLGQEANKVTFKTLVPEIISEKLYREYEKKKSTDTDAWKAWKKWIDKKSLEIFEELSDGNDTTNAPGMDATGGISHAAAVRTAGAEQPPSTEVLLGLQKQADDLRTTIESMHTDMDQCLTLVQSLMREQARAKSVLQELQMQLGKAMDAQGAGAPASASKSVNALDSTALASLSVAGPAALSAANVSNSSTGGALKKRKHSKPAKKPTDVLTLKFKEALSNALRTLFVVKYPNRKLDNAPSTESKHVRTYFTNFIAVNMQKLQDEVEDTSKYTPKDCILQSLLLDFRPQVQLYMDMQNTENGRYKPTEDINAIQMYTSACEDILNIATDHGNIPWEEKTEIKTPLSTEDSFWRERFYISNAFVDNGVPCSYMDIQLPVKMESANIQLPVKMEKKTEHASHRTAGAKKIKRQKTACQGDITSWVDLTLDDSDTEDESP
jgi:hypothetical protein